MTGVSGLGSKDREDTQTLEKEEQEQEKKEDEQEYKLNE